MLRLLITALIAAALLLPACATRPADSESPAPKALSSDQLTGTWIAVSLPGIALPQPSGIDSARNGPPTIEFSQSRAAGFSGVNRFAGDLTLNATGPGGLRFGPIVSTKMAGPADRMALEAAFLKALADTTAARIEGDDLILTAHQAELLRLRRQR